MDQWKTFVRTCVVLATITGAYLLYQLGEIVVVLFVAVIFASAIRPLVVWFVRRGVPQSAAILLIYLAFFAGLFGLLSLALPPLISLMIDFFSEGVLDSQINRLLVRLAFFSERQFQIDLPTYEIPAYMQGMVTEATQDTARQQAWPVAQGTLVVLGQIALAFVMGFYWLTARAQIQRLLLNLVPYQKRADVEVIWNDIEQMLGSYVRGQMILMIIIGVLSFLGLLVLRVPYALALAVIAGITEAIPVIGPILGAIPAIIVGFTVSPLVGLGVAIWYLVLQQIEGNVLVPKVMHENVGLNPLVVLLAITAGAALNGVVGAILAIPLVGALQVLIQRLWIEPTIEKTTTEAKEAIANNVRTQDSDEAVSAESKTTPAAQAEEEQPASERFQQV